LLGIPDTLNHYWLTAGGDWAKFPRTDNNRSNGENYSRGYLNYY
jgi:hypothetical protein